MAAKVDNRKPSDSMKSTWRIADRRTWSFYHYFYHFMDICPTILGKEVPKFSKDDKVPHLPNWQHTVWVLFYAAVPIAANHAYITYTGHNFSPAAAYGFCATALVVTAMNANKIFRRLGYQYGYFDGDVHERDGIPDAGIAKTFWSINIGMFARTLIMVGLAYRGGQTPASMNWAMLPLQIGVYPIVVDFFFYWYHRSMHDVGSLWKFHRTHHLTKHPNALLALYADSEQELCDVVLVPTLAFFTMKAMGLGMGFYEFWVCHLFIIFTEIQGHTGLRLSLSPPSTLAWLLEMLDMELALEDHDLHHRRGYRSSHNYGKQTRIWDRVFGTCAERIECRPGNIDYVNTASMPLF